MTNLVWIFANKGSNDLINRKQEVGVCVHNGVTQAGRITQKEVLNVKCFNESSIFLNWRNDRDYCICLM